MNNRVSIEYSSLDLNKLETGLSTIIEFFIKMKDRIIQNKTHNDKLITENIISNEEDINDFIFANLDMLISISKNKKEQYDEYYILIRLREMLDFVLTRNELNKENAEILINILESYKSFLNERSKMREIKDFSKYYYIYDEFENLFFILEADFYSLIDSFEESYEKTIDETYNVLREIK